MRALTEYYDPHVSMGESVDALCDPSLDHERNRDQVNQLLMNLVVRYVAEYLQAPPEDVAEVKRRAEQAVQKTTEDVLQMLADVVAKQVGVPQLAGTSQTDKLAVESLVDIRATAAIMKEIIFGGVFQVERHGPFANHFIGVDLGHGTGVLMLAAAIAARRKELGNILVIGLDISPAAVENSVRTLKTVLSEEQFRVGHGDITDPNLWAVFEGLPLHYVVSETIGPSTPPIEKQSGRWIMKDTLRGGLGGLDFSLVSHADTDPFPQVFMNAISRRPSLEEDVLQGRTAMFPDLIGGRFTPNHEQSTLVLRTAPRQTPVPLHEVGGEFSDFEEFGLGNYRRWQEWEGDLQRSMLE